MNRRRLALCLAVMAALLPATARARPPDGAALVRLMGDRATAVFAPRGSPGIGALVRLPPGTAASDVGLTQVAPGFARLWGPPSSILAFADSHPDLPLEVSPPLHLLLDQARVSVAASVANDSGMDGLGVYVGIADTGVDVTHADFLDATGKSRVDWFLDLSSPPLGKWPDLEQKYGTTDSSGNLVAGAVWAKADIDALLGTPGADQLPQDEAGHGTLVASCAAGNGAGGTNAFQGVAPKAMILAARVTGQGSEQIGNDELLRGTQFLFDRADFMQKPVVVNLSIGTDFGPHDGTTSWEQVLASHVGSSFPGHALVVAAGNSGSIADGAVHQSVFVSSGATVRVPLTATNASQSGGVEVWVALHSGSSVSVGLDAPGGTWISPVKPGDSGGKNTSAYTAAVYNGSQPSNSPVPAGSDGAVVVWQGAWGAGTYSVTLTGTGTVDLYVEGTGDQASAGVGWANGVREGTINLPASHPDLIGVGCTINKPKWRTMAGYALGLSVPELDAVGGAVDPGGAVRDPLPGEPCWFSSAGPNLLGVQKPEIMAPGAAIVGALSNQAVPPATGSIFTNPSCPSKDGAGTNPDCQQVDPTHAVSFGTSFSSPLVAGAVAVLMQKDPTLTQGQVLAALQGGAHPLRSAAPFQDQGGPGEVDVIGALAALDATAGSAPAVVPSADASWIALGADIYLADSSTPLEAILQLRADANGGAEPAPAGGFDASRLVPHARVDGSEVVGAVASFVQRGPGVWVANVTLPAGLGGHQLVVGATFDGEPIVSSPSIPIATDTWNADYPPTVQGGCVTTGGRAPPWGSVLLATVVVLWSRRRRRRIE